MKSQSLLSLAPTGISLAMVGLVGRGGGGAAEMSAGRGGDGGAGAGRSVSTFQMEEGHSTEADSKPQSDLHSSAMEGHLDNLSKELAGASAQAVNEADDEGRTALHWAADRGHVEAVKLLLETGADPNVQDKEGQTALHYAAICEHEGVAKLLIASGASTSVADNEAKTAGEMLPSAWM